MQIKVDTDAKGHGLAHEARFISSAVSGVCHSWTSRDRHSICRKPIISRRPDPVELRSCAGDARQFCPSAARNCAANPRGCLFGFCRRRASRSKLDPVPGTHHLLSRRRCLGSSGCRAIPTRPRAPASRRGGPPKGSPMCMPRSPSMCAKGYGAWRASAPFDAMISLNMVHIAPWEAALGSLPVRDASEAGWGPRLLRALACCGRDTHGGVQCRFRRET